MIKNYEIINKKILTNGNNKFYHLSTKPLEDIKDTSKSGSNYIGNTNLYYHPVGLYFSCGNNYFKKDKSLHYTYLYEIELNKSSILQINNINDFINFINKYKYPKSIIKIHNILDWKKIKQDFDGMSICPLLGKQIFGNTIALLDIYFDENIIHNKVIELYGKNWIKNITCLSEWYRYWGSEGVIWRPSGIKKISLILKTDIFKKI